MSEKRSVKKTALRGLEIIRSRTYLDQGSPGDTLLLTGVARSGTTWLGGILQYATGYRSIFEPFFPLYVPLSGPVGYFPYASKDCKWPELELFADRVVSGSIRNKWVDRDNRKLFFSGRIIKEIRLNFALGWFGQRYPRMPIILMIRNPLDIYLSWSKLNWLNSKTDEHFALQRLLFDRRFNEIYPEVSTFFYSRNFKPTSFSQFIYDWYLSYAIPIRELEVSRYLFLGYEELSRDFDGQVNRLNHYLGTSFLAERLVQFSNLPSSTDYGNRLVGSNEKKQKLINKLRDEGEFNCADNLLQKLSGMRLEDVFECPASAFRNCPTECLHLADT